MLTPWERRKKVWLMVGVPIAGIGTIFYLMLLLGMAVTKLWRWGLGALQRISKKRWEKLVAPSLLANSGFHE